VNSARALDLELLSCRCNRHKKQIERIEILAQIGEWNMVNSLFLCALSAEKREKQRRKGQSFESATHHCGSQYCAFCGWRRTKRFRDKYVPRLLRCIANGDEVIRATFTTPNPSEIYARTYDSLFSQFISLKQQPYFKERIAGALVRAETTFNKDRNDFHPHLEAILVVRLKLKSQEVVQGWRRHTGHRAKCYRVRLDRNNPYSSRANLVDKVTYICKEISLDIGEGFGPLYVATKGKQLVRPYGVLRKKKGASYSGGEVNWADTSKQGL